MDNNLFLPRVLWCLVYCGSSAVSINVPQFEPFYTIPNESKALIKLQLYSCPAAATYEKIWIWNKMSSLSQKNSRQWIRALNCKITFENQNLQRSTFICYHIFQIIRFYSIKKDQFLQMSNVKWLEKIESVLGIFK